MAREAASTVGAPHWRDDPDVRELMAVARDSDFDIVGIDTCTTAPIAKVAVALLRGLRDDRGLLYFEAHPARGGSRPPDILLCTESVGVLSIEIKAHSIEKIERAANGALYVRYGGRIRSTSVIHQARSAMFEMKTAIARHVEQGQEPFIDFLVVLPSIARSDWDARQFHLAFPDDEIWLRDDLQDPSALRRRLAERAAARNTRTGVPLLRSDALPKIRAAFGDTAVIREHRSSRDLPEGLSLGAIIDELAVAERNLSAEQQELSRKGFDGRPRVIRGVAGSGKTIILANMIARTLCEDLKRDEASLFPSEHPRRIAAVCFNRCLVPFIEAKIQAAFGSFSGRELEITRRPVVTHANGLMYWLSKQDGAQVQYLPIRAGDANGLTTAERAAAYRANVERSRRSGSLDPYLFDTILVDESQDLEPDELRVLHDLCRSDPRTGERNLVIFYDDAQNLYGRTRPVWNELGIQARGRTFVMKECFRNTRQIVEFAFNVLLGTGAPPEERARTRTFADVAYLSELGLVHEGQDFIEVKFADRDDGEVPEVHRFVNRNAEIEWITGEILDLIENEHVRPEDILVVAEAMGPFADLVARLGKLTGVRGVVQPHRDDDRDSFIFRPGCLTVTTTKSAKGYDASIVFVAGADRFQRDNSGRASFYVGCTRAKYRLYVSGIRGGQRSLLDESALVCERMVPGSRPIS